MLIIITGATKGIGNAIANIFASHDYDLCVTARNSKELEKLQDDFQSRYKVKVYFKTCDLSIKSEVENFGNYVLSLVSPIGALINNVGVYLPQSILSANENLQYLLDTNLMSAFYLTRILSNKFIEQKNGHIFNISSIAGIEPYLGGGLYGISKYAMQGFSDNLRLELMPYNIKVTTVQPGATLTNSWHGSGVNETRLMPVEDIATLIYAAYNTSQTTCIETILARPIGGDINISDFN